MFVPQKSAQEFYQLFSGIYENKLFLQIVRRDGTLRYAFESKELDVSDEKTLCMGIIDACYDFFDPVNFKFDDDFILGTKEPLLIRRYGEKAVFEEQKVIKCRSFDDLPAVHSRIFMESFLPFEKPLERPPESNLQELINNSPKWITVSSLFPHGIAE